MNQHINQSEYEKLGQGLTYGDQHVLIVRLDTSSFFYLCMKDYVKRFICKSHITIEQMKINVKSLWQETIYTKYDYE